MNEQEKKKHSDELDKFWDIDALIPRKTAPRYASDTETAEIVIEPPKSASVGATAARAQSIPPATPDRPKPRFIPPHTADEEQQKPAPLLEYIPANALIRNVRIHRFPGNYHYYEAFARNAKRLHPVMGIECPRVPFFGYVPQYTQMSRAQLAWYLWWRENARRGVYLDTDYSYVLLYIYELINLSDVTDPAKTRDTLLALWKHYREIFRQMSTYLPDWICDLSIIHHLPPPELSPALRAEIMANCALKEFYLSESGDDVYVRALLAFCSNYDYRKSKFYGGERAALFDRTVPGALQTLIDHTKSGDKLFSALHMDDSSLTRDAYNGVPCASHIKRRIEVRFCSFSRAHELRYLVTDVIKYTENKLRAHWGIRSRLTIYALPTAIRDLLDSYTKDLLPASRKPTVKQEAEAAAYEALYDLPRRALSLTNAAEIERLSWDTTERLVEAFEEEEPTPVAAPAPAAAPIPASPDPTPSDNQSFTRYLAFLKAVAAENAEAQRKEAALLGLPLDVVADEINALAADTYGDVLLEESNNGYAVIEDYRDLLDELTGQA